MKHHEEEVSLGNRLMLIGHILNGIAVTLLSVGSILRDTNEIPHRFREFGERKSDSIFERI